MEHSKNNISKRAFYLFLFSIFLLSEGLASAQFGGGGGGRGGGGGGRQPAFPTALPPTTVTALPFDGPAPWGTNPSTIPGATVSGAITGTGFVQEIVTLPGTGGSFWYQRIEAPDGTFLSESYVKKENAFKNCSPPQTPANPIPPFLCPGPGQFDTTGSVNPTGNVIFNVVVKDPANGMTNRAWLNGFTQPISIHSDVVDSQAQGAANVSGFNEMNMHFSQVPYKDASGTVLVRQDIGVWITGLAGVQPTDVTRDEGFVPNPTLRGPVTASTPSNGGGGGGRGGFGGGGGGGGGIDFWNDLTVVKIINPVSQQIVTYSKCNDYGDPTGRLDQFFRNDLGSRGGCQAAGSSSSGRPAIPDHSSDSFQLTPIDYSRSGFGGAVDLASGGPGGSGGLTTFPGSGGGGGFGGR